jgi:hypothetical protein
MADDNASVSRPFVSIVLTGRNDGYGGDFVGRFLATLRFNSRELSARGIPHEFVLVEWAPIPGAQLLADLVDAGCPASVTDAFRTVVVDPAYHEAVTLNPRLKYQEYIAKNVGIRRARGEYLITSNCDIFLSRRILERLDARDLQPNVLYRAPRWDLKDREDLATIDWPYLEDPASLSGRARVIKPPYYSGGAGDFILMDSATFHRLGGFNEVYRVVRIAIDGNFVVNAAACGVPIADVGGPVYHLDHAGSYRMTRADFVGREAEAPYGDERWGVDRVVYRNRPGWGLAGAPERSLGPRRTYLDFSQQAAPPFVDVAAIVPLGEQRARIGSGETPLTPAAVPSPKPVPDAAPPVDADLQHYARAVRELKADLADTRDRIDGATAVFADVRMFARRRRRKADEIAEKRGKSLKNPAGA